ncbi:Lar family restriction alleviation protein [Kosakonia arachidis]|uniref:Lar family restriction alleviation protein n=1 Tax=Kosakonia arachidis TaxID=551989 RepID=UPI000B7CC2D4|nr:Lar family restriction alleviation protein [Kosakonia arachidis]
MRHDNVRPCPFCGCNVIRIRRLSGYFRASCCGCEATASFQESEQEVVNRWNRRVNDTHQSGAICQGKDMKNQQK